MAKVTDSQIVGILSAAVLFVSGLGSIALSTEFRTRKAGGEVVTHQTVAAVMRAMATHQTRYLRKEFTMLKNPYAKALLAFGAIVAANLWAQLTATRFVYPHNTSGWVALVVTSILGSFIVWAKGNFTTDPTIAAKQSVILKDTTKTS